jgi:type IV pilus assembly protein PilM
VFLFTRRKTPLVGIDISSTSVKLLELTKSASGYRVEHYAVEPLPDGAINEKAIADADAVGEAIQKAIKRSGTKTKHCAMAVPSSAVITKIITMPASLKEEDMEGQVQLEADQYIPFALEEVNLDFYVLGATDGNPETVDVLLAASRSENVEMRIAAAEYAGLVPKVVDVEAYAVENAFELLSGQISEDLGDKTVGIVDMGATMTSLNVISERKMIYTREQPFGGKQLTDGIMQRYGLSYEDAGLAKKEGGLPENYVPEVLEPFKETIVQQINRLLQFFYSTSQHDGIDHILMAGGCASIAGIDELLDARLSISTSVANPFVNTSLSAKINPEKLGADAASLVIACGLSTRSFD